LIVVGMHRSGTSLAASLLASAGMSAGDRLMEGNWSNPRGHFEDLDFVELHMAALERLSLHRDGWSLTEVRALPADLAGHACWLVDQKAKPGRPWCFKDPRATLFVRMWLELVPAAKFLVVFRPPWEVVDSLYRRGDSVFDDDPALAINVWMHYNRSLLSVAAEAPDRFFLTSVDAVAAAPARWVDAVKDWLGVPLGAPDPAICDPHLLHGRFARAEADLVARHFPDALRLLADLEKRGWRPDGWKPAPVPADPSDPEEARAVALRSWQEKGALAFRCERLGAELEQLREEARQRGGEKSDSDRNAG
jgi:hypothetical protein